MRRLEPLPWCSYPPRIPLMLTVHGKVSVAWRSVPAVSGDLPGRQCGAALLGEAQRRLNRVKHLSVGDLHDLEPNKPCVRTDKINPQPCVMTESLMFRQPTNLLSAICQYWTPLGVHLSHRSALAHMAGAHVAVSLRDRVFVDGLHLKTPRLRFMQTGARSTTSVRTSSSPGVFDGDFFDQSERVLHPRGVQHRTPLRQRACKDLQVFDIISQ